MAVVIRMKRTGRKNRPCYRISVSDSRFASDGRVIESIGIYDPIAPRAELRLTLDTERARHWIAQGALPSDTVASILRRNGIFAGRTGKPARDRSGRSKKTAKKAHRAAAKATRAAEKAGRRATRVAAKKAAAKAAAPAEPA
jgi:small subunit ribosomal protein S16